MKSIGYKENLDLTVEQYREIIDSFPTIQNRDPLYDAAGKLARLRIADPGKPTDKEWKKLLTWARAAQRAGLYHTSGIEAILEMLDKKVQSYGTEAIFGHKATPAFRRYWMDICGQYLNTGDTYSTTILYDAVKERFLLTSWGDFVERNEKKYGTS